MSPWSGGPPTLTYQPTTSQIIKAGALDSPEMAMESTELRSTGSRLDEATSRAEYGDHPYVAFLKETFDVSDVRYADVFMQFVLPRAPSSRTLPRSSITYECFDFYPNSGNQPPSPRQTSFQGPINQSKFGRPPANGGLRILVVGCGEFPSHNTIQVMDDVGVYFKLPPYVFAPFVECRLVDATPWNDMYAETLVLRVKGEPIVVQEVVMPGSEPTDLTCSKSASRHAS